MKYYYRLKPTHTTELIEVSCTLQSVGRLVYENKNEVMDLSGSAVEIIQRHPVCIALTDQSDGVAKANAKKIMQTMTDNFSCNPTMTPRSPREDTVFCILQENDKLAQAIRSLCNLSLEKEIDFCGIYKI